MGRSLIKRITLKIGRWQVTEERGSWNVRSGETRFSLREESEGSWRLSYQSTTGSGRRQTRKWFQAPDLGEAVTRAEEALYGRGEVVAVLTPAEVLARWAKTLASRRDTLADYDTYVRLFLSWAEIEGLDRWKDLRLEHLQGYAKRLVWEGKAWDTVRLYTYPIRAAARWASLNWPGRFDNFSAGFRLPRRPRSKSLDPLRLTEVADFLVFLERDEESSKLLPGVALQTLCGLRVMEALRLTWGCIDVVRGLVTIDGEVKNDSSRRILPLPQKVWDILLRSGRVGERVVWAFSARSAWRRAVQSALKRWRPEKVVSPKMFRKTLATEMRLRGWNRDLMDLYYGHTERDILGEHYIRDTASERMELFRREVADRIDEVLAETGYEAPISNGKVVPLRAVR